MAAIDQGELNDALFGALDAGNLKQVRLLLKKGADPEAQRGRDGSALRVALGATGANAQACAQALLEAGANPNKASGQGAGETPLQTLLSPDHSSAERRANGSFVSAGYLNVEWLLSSAGHLIKAGADIHAKDHRGWTPLMLACSALRSTAAMELLDAGADPLARDKLSGRQALGMLSHAIDSRGGSPRAWPEVERALALVERLVRLGSDFETAPGLYPPAAQLGGSAFTGVRAVTERLILERLGLTGAGPSIKAPRL